MGARGHVDRISGIPGAERRAGHRVSGRGVSSLVYADTAVLGSQFRWRCVPSIVRTPSALPRMLHASDWPFPANSLVFWHRLHPFTTLGLMAEKNLFLRDFRLKLALGMPPESFDRMGELLGARTAGSPGSP